MRQRVCARLVSVGLALAALGCDDEPARPASPPAAALSAPKPNAQPARVEFKAQAMGTEVQIIAYTTPRVDEAGVRDAIGQAMGEIARLEALMSSWRKDSEVSRINRQAPEPVKVSPETLEVVEKSLWAGKLSEGTFDITFQSMSDLWKFGDAADREPKPPSPRAVKAKLPLVDYRRVLVDLDACTVQVPKGVQIGLGGIAKGYIVDRAASVLKQAGLVSFLVKAGGDLIGVGRKPDGSPWVSGIQDPRAKSGDYFATLELTDHAFSTAGDYARSYVHDGKRYHHIIDPRTGYPATASRSVTVWAPSALLADAVDDAVFILGPERGLELAAELNDVGVVVVDAQNRVHISPILKDKVKILQPPSDGI